MGTASADDLDTKVTESQGDDEEEKSPAAKEVEPQQGLHLNKTWTTEDLDAILADLGPAAKSPRADEPSRQALGLAAMRSTDLDRIPDGPAPPPPREDPYRLRTYLAALARDALADAEILVPADPSRVSTRCWRDGEEEEGGDVSVARTEVSGLTEPEAGGAAAVAAGATPTGEGDVAGDIHGDDALARYRGEVEFAAFDGNAAQVLGRDAEGRIPISNPGGLVSKLVQLLSACGCLAAECGDLPEPAREEADRRGKPRSGSDSVVTQSTTRTSLDADPAS